MFCEKCVTSEALLEQKNRNEINPDKIIKDFIDGPLQRYLTGNISFGKFKELVNETCGTNFSYSDLYPSYLFNAKLSYEEADRMLLEDLGTI